jgi:hypothetical protein
MAAKRKVNIFSHFASYISFFQYFTYFFSISSKPYFYDIDKSLAKIFVFLKSL